MRSLKENLAIKKTERTRNCNSCRQEMRSGTKAIVQTVGKRSYATHFDCGKEWLQKEIKGLHLLLIKN